MNDFLKFIASSPAKGVRIVAGITLTGAGISGKRDTNRLLAFAFLSQRVFTRHSLI